jgi:hypothetical protein
VNITSVYHFVCLFEGEKGNARSSFSIFDAEQRNSGALPLFQPLTDYSTNYNFMQKYHLMHHWNAIFEWVLNGIP